MIDSLRMKKYLKVDEWKIIEEGWVPDNNQISESIFSIGNGRMGQRANFEEAYTGQTLKGSYVAGVYYPDKTRVGWWKNGYPEYFAKVLNAPSWIEIPVVIDGQELDLAKVEVLDFRRELNMEEGYLERTFHVRFPDGKELKGKSVRVCSLVDDEVGAIAYSLTPVNFSGDVQFSPLINGDIKNEDANYDDKFWDLLEVKAERGLAWVNARTKKTNFEVCTGMTFIADIDGEKQAAFSSQPVNETDVAGYQCTLKVGEGQTLTVYKYAGVVSSENHKKADLVETCKSRCTAAHSKGFATLLAEQRQAWKEKWEEADIRIEGDPEAQQGIRFNIFQLYQTYTGADSRLNIGPKGFTGEKYGGSTYWDTEAYCLPFYLATADQEVARNLLVYRYNHLQKAIENAEKLGFSGGAALYPMVTMNGEECHNEWEITFEEIHRNGAIAYAIFDYIRYTGEDKYLVEYGLQVLISIARFWVQRVNFSQAKQKYVMLGVTGPNEYENNVNNNWYTNRLAVWCLNYTLEALAQSEANYPADFKRVTEEVNFDPAETAQWRSVVDQMYYPEDTEKGVFLQQDGFLDKELVPVSELGAEHRPINQNWSWDRILRSCYIKQADVLQGLYFLEDHYDLETIQRNFDFYEPLTVHESSLSPCVHVVLAARLGYEEKAYEMYLRTSRLDLDDYNNDTEDGCHITSMGGTWLSVVKGFGGMQIVDGVLHFSPMIPANWSGYSFKIRFRGAILEVKVSTSSVEVHNHSVNELEIRLMGKDEALGSHKSITASL